MTWDILWLVIWVFALVGVPLLFWLGGVGSAVAAYNDRTAVAVSSFGLGIILAIGWFILVAYNIINQVITLVNGG